MGRTLTGPLWLNLSYTLWEVPVFVKAGSIIPTAPPATSDTARGNAARLPATLLWEVWHGGRTSGQGRVYEEGQGTTYASYQLAADKMSLRFSVTSTMPTPTHRGHQLLLKQTWAAVDVVACAGSDTTLVGKTRFSGADLELTVAFQSTSGDGLACVEITFALPLDTPSLLATPYRGLRLRAHRFKAQLDHFYPTPTPKTMDIVVAAATGTRISAHPERVMAEVAQFFNSTARGVARLLAEEGLSKQLQQTALAWLAPAAVATM